MENKSDQKNSQNDVGDVEAFFAKNRKNKSDKKTKKNVKGKASEPTADQEQTKKEDAKPEPETKAGPNFDGDDSDEEIETIVLEATKVQDMKTPAEKEEEKKADDDKFGWGKMESKAKSSIANQEVKKPVAASGKPGEISFGKRPMMFTSAKRKGLGLAGQEEFPELGATGAPGKGAAKGQDAGVSKANSSAIGQFGAMAQERDGERPQEHKPAQKPIFKGKAKLNLGGNTDVNARQNYDFSSMNMAQATSGPKLDEDGKPIPREPRDEQRSYQRAREQAAEAEDVDDFADFEVVTEKKKPQARDFSDDAW